MRHLVRLFRAWLSGRYRVVPWRTLAILCVVVLYAVAPIDLIPDYIPFVGVVDDVAMLGFLWRSLVKDMRKFVEWEQHHKARV